jgi:C4-type Zn-finger protein
MHIASFTDCPQCGSVTTFCEHERRSQPGHDGSSILFRVFRCDDCDWKFYSDHLETAS